MMWMFHALLLWIAGGVVTALMLGRYMHRGMNDPQSRTGKDVAAAHDKEREAAGEEPIKKLDG
jgi:hypothetical protein